MDDECGESMEPMGKVPLVKLCESELENCSNKTRVRAIAASPGTKDSEIWTLHFTPSPTEKRSIVMSMHVCVCVCVFVCLRSYLGNYTSDFKQFLYMLPMPLARSSSAAMLCISAFIDDVIFAHKQRLLDVAAQLKRSAHAALGLAIGCAQYYQLHVNGRTELFFGRLK